MTPVSTTAASRYFQRWVAAAPGRAELVAALAAAPLHEIDLAPLLARDTATGLALPRAMRRLRNLLVCSLIARDLDGRADLHEVVTAMTRFADFAVQTHLAALMEELVAAHGMPIGEESGLPQEMIVLAMGKHGGGELNVSSDIDLIFVFPEDGETTITASEQRQLSNQEFFARLGKRLIAAMSEVTEDGFTFRVDMALRPNGNSGPLVASLNMVERYLIVQGREWERYAWVKARAVTGSAPDIALLAAIVRPFCFRRYLDYGVIDAIRTMHGQIRAEVDRQERLHPDRSNNVKLGRGGIREIEFLAQVFQLIRGGRDTELRDRSTRTTLRTVADKGLLERPVVERLQESYIFLRNLEHRLQYLDDAQTHTLPVSDADRATVAAMMGAASVDDLLTQLAGVRQFVATEFDQMFSDKSGKADPDEPEGPVCFTELDNVEAIEAHLTSLGFDQPNAAAKRLLATWQSPRVQTMPEGSRNRLVALINTALPLITACALENGIGSGATTLGRLLDFFEAVARRSAYLSLLTEYPHTLDRVIRMIHASGWAATFLTQHPIVLDELLDDRLHNDLLDCATFAPELRRMLIDADGDTERQMDILREAHHAQLFRLLAQDLAGQLSVEHLADYLSLLADCIVEATIAAVWKTVATRHVEVPKFAVIAYGKLGGKELGYVSDLDVIFLYDDDDDNAPSNYARLAQRFITWMTAHTPAGILFDIDTALRPDGASGMLVSTVGAFEKYQHKSAWVWEHQALTRARFCAGDAAIGQRFEAIRQDVLRLDRSSTAAELKAEVVKMRQKMRDAHPPRPELFDLKQDVGGMIDIEFMVQYLVLRHACECPQLTINIGNIALLRMCAELGLIDAPLAAAVGDAYRAMRRLQHGLRLQGQDNARVDPARVAQHSAPVVALWQAIFGDVAENR